jgi:hypothetical protein
MFDLSGLEPTAICSEGLEMRSQRQQEKSQLRPAHRRPRRVRRPYHSVRGSGGASFERNCALQVAHGGWGEQGSRGENEERKLRPLALAVGADSARSASCFLHGDRSLQLESCRGDRQYPFDARKRESHLRLDKIIKQLKSSSPGNHP